MERAESMHNKQMGNFFRIFSLEIIFKRDGITETWYSHCHIMNSLPATDQEL